MQFTTSIVALLSAAALTAAAPAAPAPESPVGKRDDCVVNAANSGVWHEFGLSRYRTAFSCQPAEMCSQYCDYFKSGQ
jgi:ribosomal protein S14